MPSLDHALSPAWWKGACGERDEVTCPSGVSVVSNYFSTEASALLLSTGISGFAMYCEQVEVIVPSSEDATELAVHGQIRALKAGSSERTHVMRVKGVEGKHIWTRKQPTAWGRNVNKQRREISRAGSPAP